MKLGKPQRQHRVARLLEDHAVSNQAQLVALLAEQGVEATQTTVSRDLEEIGAIKVRVPGATPCTPCPSCRRHQVAPEDHLRRVLGEWVVETAHSGNLVVLRTPPGCAHVVGSALDRSGFEGMIGTVAGDDTVLVVAAEETGGAVLAQRLAELAGTNGTGAGATAAASPQPARRPVARRQPARQRVAWTGTEQVMAKRVVLAHSGGLDTSVAVRWLQEELGVEVIAVALNVGQGGDFEVVRSRALAAGAVEAVVDRRPGRDGRGLRACPPSPPTPSTRASTRSCRRCRGPVIVRHLVDEARRHGADARRPRLHRARATTRCASRWARARWPPTSRSWRRPASWGMTREDCVEYAARFEIPIEATKEKLYSIDENLWGRAIECGALEDPWAAPPDDVFTLTRPTATEPRDLVLGFESGVPVTVDGQSLGLAELIAEVASVVGSYGWGRIDMVENRRVGIKSRETYECPAALALLLAHSDLEDLTLERDVAREKARLEPRWAELVYDGMWFSPLKEAIDAFFASTQRHVTGEVRLALSPGGCMVTGRRSPVSLYDHGLATYDAADTFAPRRRRGVRAPVGPRPRHVGGAPGRPRAGRSSRRRAGRGRDAVGGPSRRDGPTR